MSVVTFLEPVLLRKAGYPPRVIFDKLLDRQRICGRHYITAQGTLERFNETQVKVVICTRNDLVAVSARAHLWAAITKDGLLVFDFGMGETVIVLNDRPISLSFSNELLFVVTVSGRPCQVFPDRRVVPLNKLGITDCLKVRGDLFLRDNGTCMGHDGYVPALDNILDIRGSIHQLFMRPGEVIYYCTYDRTESGYCNGDIITGRFVHGYEAVQYADGSWEYNDGVDRSELVTPEPLLDICDEVAIGASGTVYRVDVSRRWVANGLVETTLSLVN